MPPRRRKVPGTPGPGAPLSVHDIARAATMKQFRERREMSQAELGSMLGVGQSSIAAYEGAKTRIPDDIFEQLVKTAGEEYELAGSAEEANAAAAGFPFGDGEIPPEILKTLEEAAEAVKTAPNGDEAARRLSGIAAGVAGKATGKMNQEQQKAVAGVQMAYGFLAKIASRFDPLLGQCIDEDSGALAVSVVEAAEVSPFFARIVAWLTVGPVSGCVLMHILLVAKYDSMRSERNRELRRMRELEPQPAPPPRPASTIEQIDPTVGPFAAAAA